MREQSKPLRERPDFQARRARRSASRLDFTPSRKHARAREVSCSLPRAAIFFSVTARDVRDSGSSFLPHTFQLELRITCGCARNGCTASPFSKVLCPQRVPHGCQLRVSWRVRN